MKRLIHKLKIKILCLLGLALDIHSKGRWPSYALSNFYPHQFEFDGVQCGRMEGFLQSLKTNDKERQILVCAMSKKEAKLRSTDTWKKEQNVYWNGKAFNRHGYQFQILARRAYRAMLKQCHKFRDKELSAMTNGISVPFKSSNQCTMSLLLLQMICAAAPLKNK